MDLDEVAKDREAARVLTRTWRWSRRPSPCPTPTSTTCATGCAAPAGPRPRRSTTGRRASRSPTCRSCARYWADGLRLAGRRGPAERVRAVPHRDRRARHPLPPRPLARARRAAARHHPRLAGLGRRVPQRDRAAHRPGRATAATPPTRSTSCARRCRATASATSPPAPGWDVERIAGAWAELMARLGYDRYGAQGGDWGAMVTTALGAAGPRPRGRHPPEHAGRPRPVAGDGRARPSESGAGAGRLRRAPALGHRLLHSSSRPGRRRWATASSTRRPGSARGSSRSSGPGPTATATRRTSLARDELLDNVMLYWLPGTGASSARLYWESFRLDRRWSRSTVPVGRARSSPRRSSGRPAAGPRRASPTSATGTSSTAAATSPRSSSRSCSSTRCARSSARALSAEPGGGGRRGRRRVGGTARYGRRPVAAHTVPRGRS